MAVQESGQERQQRQQSVFKNTVLGQNTFGQTINVSVIPPDESDAFISRTDQQDLFGFDEFKPDKIRIPEVGHGGQQPGAG